MLEVFSRCLNPTCWSETNDSFAKTMKWTSPSDRPVPEVIHKWNSWNFCYVVLLCTWLFCVLVMSQYLEVFLPQSLRRSSKYLKFHNQSSGKLRCHLHSYLKVNSLKFKAFWVWKRNETGQAGLSSIKKIHLRESYGFLDDLSFHYRLSRLTSGRHSHTIQLNLPWCLNIV